MISKNFFTEIPTPHPLPRLEPECFSFRYFGTSVLPDDPDFVTILSPVNEFRPLPLAITGVYPYTKENPDYLYKILI